MERRTIKDIELECEHDDINEVNDIVKLTCNNIRDEAINRVKIWKSHLSDNVWQGITVANDRSIFLFDKNKIRTPNEYSLIGRISCFVEFFNIIEGEI